MLIVIHGKQLAGAGEAALYLVRDHNDAVLVADCTDSGNQLWRNHIKSALALYGFKDNRRDLGRLNIAFKQALDGVDRISGGHLMQFGRIRHMKNRTRERPETDFVRRHFARQRHRHIGAPVEAAAEGDDPRAFGMGARDFNRILHRFGAG